MQSDIKNTTKVLEYPKIDVNELVDGRLTEKQIISLIENHKSFIDKFNDNINFYIGKNAQISYNIDSNNPDNVINIPYARTMTTTVKGYMYKPGLIRYSANEDDSKSQAYFERLQEIFKINDENIKNAELGECQSKFGIGIEQLYLKTDKNNKVMPYFAVADPREIILIYDYAIEPHLVCAIRFYDIENTNDDDILKTYKIEVYYSKYIDYFLLEKHKDTTKLIEDMPTAQNFYNEVPFITYINNDEYMADYEPVKGTIVLYDKLYSDGANELDRFAAAYLIMKNYMLAENDEDAQRKLSKLKSMRIFEIQEDGDIKFLTKDIPVAFFKEMKDSLKEDIMYHSNIPDFRDAAFGTASGIAIQYKITNFENLAADKEAYFRKGLEKKLEMLTNYLRIKNEDINDESIIITFDRNLPQNILDKVMMIKEIKGAMLPVSDETLLSQLSFIEDVQAEIEKYNKQEEEKETIDLDDEIQEITKQPKEEIIEDENIDE